MILHQILLRENFDKILIISGDGDYKKLVNYLVNKKKFKRILFPSKKSASFLYKKFGSELYDNLSEPDVKEKIESPKMKRTP